MNPKVPALRETSGVENKAVPVGRDEMDVVQVVVEDLGRFHHLCTGFR